MIGFKAFTKKEVYDYLHTYKVYLFSAIILGFGIMSAILVKLMPLLFNLLRNYGIMMPEFEFTAEYAYTSLLAEFGEIGLIAIFATFTPILGNEIAKGTLVNVLTKGTTRSTVFFSKLVFSAMVWIVTLFISALASCLTATALFGQFAPPAFWYFLGGLGLYGIFTIALTLLSSTLIKGSAGGILLPLCFYVLFSLLNTILNNADIQRFNPVSFMYIDTSILYSSDSNIIMYNLPALLITIGLTVIAVIVGYRRFKKIEI